MEFTDVFIGTQSQKNLDELMRFGSTNCAVLPMPMPERGLLEPSTGNKKGVLFVGRWEEGKNPDAYMRVMKESGLPCKVMTNSNGAKKFAAAFEREGITDYEIKAGITGQEKVDFIKSCSVFFMPSFRESFSFAFLECIGHMACVVLDNQDWSENFDSQFYTKTSLNNAAGVVKSLYGIDRDPKALEYVQKREEEVAQKWIDFLNSFEGRRSKTNAAKINTYDTVKYRDYISELNRNHLAREDFESVLTNRHKFNVTYTDKDTYLSKDSAFIPIEEAVGLGLFEGL